MLPCRQSHCFRESVKGNSICHLIVRNWWGVELIILVMRWRCDAEVDPGVGEWGGGGGSCRPGIDHGRGRYGWGVDEGGRTVMVVVVMMMRRRLLMTARV